MRLDRAYSDFYRRVKRGDTPGFPRFKPVSQFTSLQWEDRGGWKLKMTHRRLYLRGIGEIKAVYHRPFIGEPKAITVKREGNRWWLNVRCANVPAKTLVRTYCAIGLDLGVVNMIATSDGELKKGNQFGTKARKNLARAQRELAAKQRGSKRRQRQLEEVVRLHRKIKSQRRDFAHQLSRQLVNDYEFIAIEQLKTSSMVRTPKGKPDPEQPGAFLPNGASSKARLNRSILDAGWGQFVALLSYKAESAGRTLVKVNPRHTSQTCAECLHVDVGNRISQEDFRCLRCGHSDFADINAARNILRAGRALQVSTCVGRRRATTLQ
jgi:putative transposase